MELQQRPKPTRGRRRTPRDEEPPSPASRGAAIIISCPPPKGSGRRLAGCPCRRDDRQLLKLPWKPYEDAKLLRLVARFGPQNWKIIAAELDGRSSKNCRLRWCNQLNPTLNKAPFSAWEDAVVYRGFKTHGTRWALIAKMLHGRTDNSVKNRWNCTLKRCDEPGVVLDNGFISSGRPLQDLLQERPGGCRTWLDADGLLDGGARPTMRCDETTDEKLLLVSSATVHFPSSPGPISPADEAAPTTTCAYDSPEAAPFVCNVPKAAGGRQACNIVDSHLVNNNFAVAADYTTSIRPGQCSDPALAAPADATAASPDWSGADSPAGRKPSGFCQPNFDLQNYFAAILPAGACHYDWDCLMADGAPQQQLMRASATATLHLPSWAHSQQQQHCPDANQTVASMSMESVGECVSNRSTPGQGFHTIEPITTPSFQQCWPMSMSMPDIHPRKDTLLDADVSDYLPMSFEEFHGSLGLF